MKQVTKQKWKLFINSSITIILFGYIIGFVNYIDYFKVLETSNVWNSVSIILYVFSGFTLFVAYFLTTLDLIFKYYKI